MMIRPLAVLLTALLAAASLQAAGDVRRGDLTIRDASARATVPSQPAGGGYLTIQNGGGGADRLVGAASEVAREVQLHSMQMDGDVMRMRQVDGIDVPAGQTVALKPGGLHLMFMGLKSPLVAGTRIPLTLRFEKAGEVQLEMQVQPAGGPPAHKH